MKNTNRIKQIAGLYPPLLLFILTPFMVALHIYFPNSSEFSVPALDMARSLLPLLGLFSLSLLIVLAIIPRTVQTYAVCLLGAVGVLFWIQGYILNWDYGVMTGTPILWSDYPTRLFMDISVWILVTALFLVFAKKIRPHLVFLSLVLLSVQGVSLIFAWTGSSEPPGFHRYTISDEKMMDFSEDKNVVILMLDAFQSDVFQEILDSEPKYKEQFKGFTFFRNTTAQYSKTYGAIPALLTGHWYENRQPIQDFLARSFEDSISTRLLREGWSTQLFPMTPRIIGYSRNYASNIHLRADGSATARQAGEMLDVGFFRSSPQFIKPFWLNDFQWRLKDVVSAIWDEDKYGMRTNVRTYKDFPGSALDELLHPILEFAYSSEESLNLESPDPTFKFLHFNIPHAPFILNENLEIENLPHDRDGFRRYSMAGLEAVGIFLKQLQAKNLYDNTMVFVVSDHGGGEYRPGVLEHEDIQTGKGDIPAVHHESGLALMLVKPFNDRGELKISDVPASLGDVLMTISEALELAHDYEGRDLFSLIEDEPRKRRYIFYEFQGWLPDYLPEMIEYEISGHAWSPSSWHPTGRVFSPAQMDDDDAEKSVDEGLKAGEIYSFKSQDGLGMLSEGWLYPEEHGAWSGDRFASLEFQLQQDIELPVKVSIYLSPYTCGDSLESQQVVIFREDFIIGNIEVGVEGWYHFILTETDGMNIMSPQFFFPDAISPMDCGTSLMPLPLAVSIRHIKVKPFDCTYGLSEIIDFSAGGDSSRFIVNGWSDQEQYHRWTNQEQARMLINVTDADKKDLLLRITAGASLKGGKSFQEVDLMVNGNHSASWKIDENRWYEAVIPSGFYENGKLDLTFNVHDPVAPCEVSESADCRKLGMLVTEMQILAYPDTP